MPAGAFAGDVRVRVSGLIVSHERIALVNQQTPTRPKPIWLPPGGGVELGEPSEKALIREVKEETNLTVLGANLKYIHEFIEPPYHAVELYFLVTKHSGKLKTGNDPELAPRNQQILRVSWLSPEEIERADLYPRFLKEELLTGSFTNPGIYHYKSL